MEVIHTPGVRLPDDRLRIQLEQERLTATGLAFTGSLTLDGAPVASIRDHGDGQGVRFDTADGESGWPGMIECAPYPGTPTRARASTAAATRPPSTSKSSQANRS
jgi:hypothetical protein